MQLHGMSWYRLDYTGFEKLWDAYGCMTIEISAHLARARFVFWVQVQSMASTNAVPLTSSLRRLMIGRTLSNKQGRGLDPAASSLTLLTSRQTIKRRRGSTNSGKELTRCLRKIIKFGFHLLQQLFKESPTIISPFHYFIISDERGTSLSVP